MKSIKHIQVFLKGEETCEVSGELVSLHHMHGWVVVKYKEEDSVWESQFPDWNINMIRISNWGND